ncbi:MAG: O-acetyl-ADP-ribose deacetylase [Thermomicrobiales bacterium]
MRFGKLTIVQGDLTQQKVDAIVNAANNALLGGGGVDGAIHRVAGPELLEECRTLGGCKTGEAKITKGYRLPARWVIHTVGPVWRGGGSNEDELLARCYRNSLAVAADSRYGIRTIAFPSISTGAYGYPLNLAADIAIDEVDRLLARRNPFDEIRFVLFSDEALKVYARAAHERFE